MDGWVHSLIVSLSFLFRNGNKQTEPDAREQPPHKTPRLTPAFRFHRHPIAMPTIALTHRAPLYRHVVDGTNDASRRRRRNGCTMLTRRVVVAASKTMTNDDATAPLRVGFVGFGSMAEAMARGFVSSSSSSVSFAAYVGPSGRRASACEALGGRVASDAADATRGADVVILATKPWMIRQSSEEIVSGLDVDRTVVVSVAAGVSSERIESWLEAAGAGRARVVRVMPNTPCAVNAAASGVCKGSRATSDDVAVVVSLMERCGICEVIDEGLIDALVGVSGSGPAYVYQVIEAMADGGVLNGLPRDVAMRLAAQTVMGAGKMVLETGEHPGALKDKVCSPNGTTIRAVAELERRGVRGAFIDACSASTNRSIELGRD